MIPNMVDVLVHVDEDLDQKARQELDESVRALKGVFSVHIPNNRHHLMIVAYNPDWTSSRAILFAVVNQGLHAELVGL